MPFGGPEWLALTSEPALGLDHHEGDKRDASHDEEPLGTGPTATAAEGSAPPPATTPPIPAAHPDHPRLSQADIINWPCHGRDGYG
jgi:hypothetical protein